MGHHIDFSYSKLDYICVKIPAIVKFHALFDSDEIFGTHVLQWTRRVHYDTLDLEAMILQEIYLFLGPLKYTSFLKVTFLKLM